MNTLTTRLAGVSLAFAGAMLLPLLPSSLQGQSAPAKVIAADDLKRLEAELAAKQAELQAMQARVKAAAEAARAEAVARAAADVARTAAKKADAAADANAADVKKRATVVRTADGKTVVEIHLGGDAKADAVKEITKAIEGIKGVDVRIKAGSPDAKAVEWFYAPKAGKSGTTYGLEFARPAQSLPGTFGVELARTAQGQSSRMDAIEKKLDTILKELEAIRKAMPAKSGKTAPTGFNPLGILIENTAPAAAAAKP